jgi:hypothetical protein
MKRPFFLIFPALAVFTFVVFLHEHQLWAKSLNNNGKQAKATAQSFMGPMKYLRSSQYADISKGTAARASITFDLSKDQTGITQISISIGGIEYEIKTPDGTKTGTRAGTNIFINGPFPIIKNIFQTRDEKNTISVKGTFISPLKAQGSAHLYAGVIIEGTRFDFDLGEWQWKETRY